MTVKKSYTWDGKQYQIPERDSLREKAYRAEREAFKEERLVSVGTFEDAVSFVRRVEASQTWKALLALVGLDPLPLNIRDGRGTRIARGGRYELNLPVWARNVPVILHEMAHAAALWAQHHWPWASAFLTLLGRFMSAKDRDRLKVAFKTHNVKFRPPRLMTPEQRAALRIRGFALAAGSRPPRPEPGLLDPSTLLKGSVFFHVTRESGNAHFTVLQRIAKGPAKPSTYHEDKRLLIPAAGRHYDVGLGFDPERMFLSEPQALDAAAGLNKLIAQKFLAEAGLQEQLAKAARGQG